MDGENEKNAIFCVLYIYRYMCICGVKYLLIFF